LKTILKLILKEYRLFLSDRVAVSLTFLVPMLLIALWGAIFGRADSGATNLRLAFLNASNTPAARNIERVLDTTKTFRLVKSRQDENGKEIPFDTASIRDFVRKGNAPAALVIPPDAFTDTSFGLKLKFYYDPKNDMEMQIIQGVLTQTIMSQIPNVFMKGMQRRAVAFLGIDSGKAFNSAIASTVGKYFGIDASQAFTSLNDTDGSFFKRSGARGDFFKNIMDFQSEQLVGKNIANPWATRSVGGWAMMFLLFSLTASSVSLFEEKQSGVVLRILASPISRVQILWGKYLYNMSLGFIQLIVLFIAGSILFRIDIFSNLLNLVLLLIAAATACTAFGMMLAAVSKTSSQARGLGTLLILTMSSVGGAWFPTSFMPDFIQAFSKLTIVYWSMDGFLQVLWRGAPFVDILPNLVILLGIAALITSVSIWQFRKGRVF
jgi:ABC-2 type transport system permease protein